MHRRKIFASSVNPKIEQNVTHELAYVAVRSEYERSTRFSAHPVQVLVQKGGLSHPRLGNQSNEASIGLGPICKRRESLPMLLAHIKEARIRGNAERIF